MAKLLEDGAFRVTGIVSRDDVLERLQGAHPGILRVELRRKHPKDEWRADVEVSGQHHLHEARVALDGALRDIERHVPAHVRIYIGSISVAEGASHASLDDGGMRLTAVHLKKLTDLGQSDAIVRQFMKLVEERAIPANDALVALIEHLSKDRARLIGLFEVAERHVKAALESYREDVVHALKRAVSFLSGLNLQDHPIDVQRESANVLRRFMLALQPNRKELELPKHAWLGDR